MGIFTILVSGHTSRMVSFVYFTFSDANENGWIFLPNILPVPAMVLMLRRRTYQSPLKRQILKAKMTARDTEVNVVTRKLRT